MPNNNETPAYIDDSAAGQSQKPLPAYKGKKNTKDAQALAQNIINQNAQLANFKNDLITNDYVFLRDAYSGGGGFKNGSYLIPHPREQKIKFIRRQLQAYYCNYVKSCVNAAVDPVFKNPPAREFTSNALFEEFLKDVDGAQTPLDIFMKKSGLKAKLEGVSFIVIDNSEETEGLSLDEATRERKYPYLYLVSPDMVTDCTRDVFGNIAEITYKVQVSASSRSSGGQKQMTCKWTRGNWEKTGPEGQKTEGENKLGVVPVIPLYGTMNYLDELFPTSDFYQIARANLAIYNACSELRERHRNQAFSLLLYPISDQDNFDMVNEVLVGTTDALGYRASGQKPEYATPSAEPSNMILQELAFIIQEIYRMADRSSVTGVNNQQSGVAKEWDYEPQNQTLADFSKNIEVAETKIAHIFGLYTTGFTFSSNYSDDFGVTDPLRELEVISAALALKIGGSFDLELKKKLAREIFKDLEDERINKILEEMDSLSEDKKRAEVESARWNNKNGR